MIDEQISPFESIRSRKYLLASLLIFAILVALEWRHLPTLAEGPAPPAPPPSAATARMLRAEGRLVAYPGAEVAVGTDLGGTLTNVAMTEKMRVKRGDLVAQIDDREQKAALAEAERRVAEAQVDVLFFERELGRTELLASTAVMSKSALDRSVHDRDVARARRDVALATVRRLDAIVKKSRIVSPIDGVVLRRFAEPGETVSPGAQLVTIADLARTRIDAEVDEYDAGRVQLGADAVIRAEGYAHASWRGKVEEIPDAVTSRLLKPTDPARPNDTRVLLVKIALSEALPVKLGQRVEVEITASPD
jgi:RND family efflux transporter MFP subunit